MIKKKTIAFAIHSLTPGGAERVLTTLANALVTHYNVKIITLVNCESFYSLNTNIELLSCGSIVSEKKSIFGAFKNHIDTVKALSGFIKTYKLDLVIGFTSSVNVLSIFATKLNNIPLIISERNNPELNPPVTIWKILRNFFYKYSDYLVVQTSANKQYFHKIMPKEKIVIIENPISPILAEKRIQPINYSKNQIILSVGRLDKNKAQDLLLKAFTNIPNHNWELILVGDGEKRQDYEALIKQLNIADKAHVLGNKINIYDYYNNACIFVFTSKSEGFPNALAEALYFGVPSISTDCPHGPSDLIEHNKNGILIDVDDQIMLEKHLKMLMNNDDIRKTLSRASIESTKKLSVEKVTNQWIKYFNKLI